MYSKNQMFFFSILYKHEISKPKLLKKMKMNDDDFFRLISDPLLDGLYVGKTVDDTMYYYLTESGKAIFENYKSDNLYTKKGPFILSVLAIIISIISVLIALCQV